MEIAKKNNLVGVSAYRPDPTASTRRLSIGNHSRKELVLLPPVYPPEKNTIVPQKEDRGHIALLSKKIDTRIK